MTRQRNDSHSTEFGLWLRGQLPDQFIDVNEIDSKRGYVASNLDYIWSNYKTGEWLLIEEKRFNSSMGFAQEKLYFILDRTCRADQKYKGFYLIVFEKTSPEDGKIWIDKPFCKTFTRRGISVLQLLMFLQFKEEQ